MRKKNWFLSMTFAVLATVVSGSDTWPQFRGPDGTGIASSTGLPLNWNEKENVRWKTSIPGKGWSSPVVFSNQIWMTTATQNQKSLRALCVDLQSGGIVRDVELFYLRAHEVLGSELSGFASPTSVIERGRFYACFGTYGNACIVTDSGKILWKNQELVFGHDNNGPGSSPIVYKDLYIVNCDGTDVRYVAALDKATGRLAWKTPRSNAILTGPGASKSYGTPQIVSFEGKEQLISPGAHRVSSYEPASGKEIWAVDLPGWAIVPRPVGWSNLVFVSTGGTKPELWAIRIDGKGVVTETHVVWKYKKQAPRVPSILVIGDRIYMTSDAGIATCLEVGTGKEVWSQRLGTGGNFYASPLFAGGQMHFFDDKGITLVVEPGSKPHIIATNRLESGCMASPAAIGHAIYLRTKTHLYRIEKKPLDN
jgi:outer membrane protein assembly factor BamB